jgi:hypothetical protein
LGRKKVTKYSGNADKDFGQLVSDNISSTNPQARQSIEILGVRKS